MGDRFDHDDERLPDTRPYLCIPYWASGGSWDTGQQRPLSTTVVSYLCPSIHAGPYTPGAPLDVTVEVRNSGGGNAASIVTVVVYWADPTVGFAKPNFFAASSVAVLPTRTSAGSTSTPTMTTTIAAGAPTHICLVVAVSHAQDPAGKVCDPAGDRHWAQRNLQAAVVARGAPALMPFNVANPFAREGDFALEVGPADERDARLVAEELGTEAADVAFTVRLLDADGAEVSGGERQAHASISLGPREQRAFQLLAEIDGELAPGQSVPLEASLLDRSAERVVGSLGLVLLGYDG